MANAVAEEASANTARPRKLKKVQRRVKRQQQEGTEPIKGTVRERKRASRADSRRTNIRQGPRSTVTSHQGTDTGGKLQGEEHKEKTGERRSPQRWTRRGLQS